MIINFDVGHVQVRVGPLDLTKSIIKTLQKRVSEFGQQVVGVAPFTDCQFLSLTELTL